MSLAQGVANKENVSPPPQCHHARLGQNVSKVIWDRERDNFEAKLTDKVPDPVQLWCDYVNWAFEWQAAGPDFEKHANETLHRACFSLSFDDRHKDEVRLLRLWVRHANKVDDPVKVFEVLQEQGMGIRHALFYEAWAACLEKQRLFDAVESTYKQGLDMHAEPVDRLQARYQDFHRRQKRRAKRKAPAATSPSVVQHELQSKSNFLPSQIAHGITDQSVSTLPSQDTGETNEQLPQAHSSVPSLPCSHPPSPEVAVGSIHSGAIAATVDFQCTSQSMNQSVELIASGRAQEPKQESMPEAPEALLQSERSEVRRTLEFGPRDPDRDWRPQTKSKRFRRTLFGYECDGEIVSVEEVRAEWMFENLRKEELGKCRKKCITDTTDAVASDENELPSSTYHTWGDYDAMLSPEVLPAKENAFVRKTVMGHFFSAGAEQEVSREHVVGQSFAREEADTDEQAPHAFVVPTQMPAQEHSLLSFSSLTTESTVHTQEVTTSCVRALLQDPRSSRPSMASTAFEDPTYTMQDVQREVIALFSSDAPGAPTAKALVDADEAMQFGSRSREILGPLAADDAMCLPVERPISTAASGGFEVFEESSFDALDSGCNLILPDSSSSVGDDGGQPELRRRSSGIPIWEDCEFDAAMR